MRVRLLIDVVTDDLPRLQRYVADQPAVEMTFLTDDARMLGRFVGAREAYDATSEVEVQRRPQ